MACKSRAREAVRRPGNKAHPAHNGAAFATLGNHVPSTAPSLAVVVAAPRRVFHVVPVASPGAVPQSGLGVDRQLLVGAVDGRFEEDGAVLQEGVVNASTSARQAVEVVEVKLSSHGHNNTGVSSQLGPPPGTEFPGRGRSLRRQKTKGAKRFGGWPTDSIPKPLSSGVPLRQRARESPPRDRPGPGERRCAPRAHDRPSSLAAHCRSTQVWSGCGPAQAAQRHRLQDLRRQPLRS